MAFNPFNVFRRNQKILFALLTVVVMFMFVLSFGQGDFFSQVPEWIGRGRQGGDVVAVIDGDKIYDSQLGEIDTRRRIANLYMSSAGARASANLRKYISDGLSRVSPENREGIKQALEVSPLYVSRVMMELAGSGRVSPEMLMADREQTLASIQNRLTDITTARAPKEADLDIARSMQALIDLDMKLIPQGVARTGHYFSNQPNTSYRDQVHFLLWLRKAEQLGIEFTDEDIDRLVAEEFYRRLSADDLRAATDELRGKRGFTPNILRSALADEFKVRAAQAAVLGHAMLRPDDRLYEAPYDYYRFYREQTSPGRFGLIKVPAEIFVPLVTEEPSESELRKLFASAKSREPDPRSKEIGLREPRKLKLDWIEFKWDAPYYKQAAEEGIQKAEVMAKVGGFLTAPIGGPSLFPLITAAAPLTVPDPVLATKYEQYRKNHNSDVATKWFSAPVFGTPMPLDTAVVRPVNVAAATAAAAVSTMGAGSPLSAGAVMVGTALAADRRARNESMAPSLIAPVGPGLPAAALATIAAQAVAVRPLPLDVVRGSLIEKAKEDFAQTILGTDIRKFNDELTKISDKTDLPRPKKAEEVRAYVEKFAKERGLQTGGSQEFRDVYSIGDDPGLATLKKKPNEPAGSPTMYTNPAEFGSRFFFEMDPTTFRQRPSESFFKPQPYQPATLFPDENDPFYLVWRSAEQEAESPRSFDAPGVKEKTIAAWKRLKARELARQAAEELARNCQNLGSTFLEIEQKLRDKRAEFAARFTQPGAADRVTYFEKMNVAPLVIQPMPGAGQYQVSAFSMPPEENIPYPSQEMLDRLVETKEKPIGTAVTMSDLPQDRYYVAVLLNRNERSADEFAFQVFGPLGQQTQVGPVVQRHHQATLHQQMRDTAIALLKAEFNYEKENTALIDRKSDSSEE